MNHPTSSCRSRLIYGLGNPVMTYDGTRHNFGARVVSYLAKSRALTMKVDRDLGVMYSSFVEGDVRILLARSLGFMNLSGGPLKALMRRQNIELEDVLIVHDDAHLDLGVTAFQEGGPLRGQNGLKSIVNTLGSDQFMRLRLGVANTQCHRQLEDYTDRVGAHVLANFEVSELVQVLEVSRLAVEKMLEWVQGGSFVNFCLPTQSS